MLERISASFSSAHIEKTSEQSKSARVHEQQLITKQENQEVPKEKLEEIIKGMNEFLQPSHTSLKFAMHEDLKEYYAQLIDERTKEVVREIPPKKLLDMYAAMMQFVGLMVDKKI